MNEIKVLQQNYDVPEASLFQILENRFNIRKEEAELDSKIKSLKDTLFMLEDKQVQAQSTLKK